MLQKKHPKKRFKGAVLSIDILTVSIQARAMKSYDSEIKRQTGDWPMAVPDDRPLRRLRDEHPDGPRLLDCLDLKSRGRAYLTSSLVRIQAISFTNPMRFLTRHGLCQEDL